MEKDEPLRKKQKQEKKQKKKEEKKQEEKEEKKEEEKKEEEKQEEKQQEKKQEKKQEYYSRFRSQYRLADEYSRRIELLRHSKHTVPQLKNMAKTNKLKVSGKKQEIQDQIENHLVKLFLDQYAMVIQYYYRRYCLKKCRGPALWKRSLCSNAVDFLSLDPVEDIPEHQFFSYKDKNNFIFAFDVKSMWHLIMDAKDKHRLQRHQKYSVINPFTTHAIEYKVIKQFRQLVRWMGYFHLPCNITLDNPMDTVSETKQIEMRAILVFQHINAQGYYADPQWLLSLSVDSLIRWFQAVRYIWTYRTEMSNRLRCRIYPPNGNLFYPDVVFGHDTPLIHMQSICLTLMERLATTSSDPDMRYIGATYALCALTLVNPIAAYNIPWLYQTVF